MATRSVGGLRARNELSGSTEATHAFSGTLSTKPTHGRSNLRRFPRLNADLRRSVCVTLHKNAGFTADTNTSSNAVLAPHRSTNAGRPVVRTQALVLRPMLGSTFGTYVKGRDHLSDCKATSAPPRRREFPCDVSAHHLAIQQDHVGGRHVTPVLIVAVLLAVSLSKLPSLPRKCNIIHTICLVENAGSLPTWGFSLVKVIGKQCVEHVEKVKVPRHCPGAPPQ